MLEFLEATLAARPYTADGALAMYTWGLDLQRLLDAADAVVSCAVWYSKENRRSLRDDNQNLVGFSLIAYA